MAKPATLDRTRSYGEAHPADVVFYYQDHKEFDHNGIEILANDEQPIPPIADPGYEGDYEDWPWKKLRAELKKLTGKGPRPGATKDQVVETLRALGAAEAVEDAED